MSDLISGKEALENYSESQVRLSSKEDWVDLKASVFTITDILREKHFNGGWHGLLFRLKPQTITVNNIEVPKPKKIQTTGGNVVSILCRNSGDAVILSEALKHIFNEKPQ